MSLRRLLLAAAALAGCARPPLLAAGAEVPGGNATAAGGSLLRGARAAGGVEPHGEPACPNMVKVSFTIPGFQPQGSGLPAGDLVVQGCSNDRLEAVQGKKGVVLFLHGAGGHADDYAAIYPGRIYRPEDYNIVFLQTPRQPGSSWMGIYEALPNLNHHWMNSEVMDAMGYLSQVVDQVAALYGGHERVWMAGFSQGAVLSAAVALRGTSRLLGGAFVVAGYPARPLYSDEAGAKEVPSDWPAADVEEKRKTKIYFYTGELDGVLPLSKSFCRFRRVVEKYGLDSGNVRFWSKTGYCHFDGDDGGACHQKISPNGNEFHALWHVVGGAPQDVAGVVPVEPGSDCKA